MPLIKKIKNKNSTKYNICGLTIYEKETLLSSKNYILLGIRFLYKKNKPDTQKLYLFGIKIKEKKINIIDALKKFSPENDFIYYCFHSGDFYYLCSLLKQNFDKFKDIKILSNFAYLKLVLELFNFDKDWIENNFIVVPNFHPSLALFYKKNIGIVSHLSIDHEKGWILNDKKQEQNGNYKAFSNSIANFVGFEHFDSQYLPIETSTEKDNKILLIPESQFNGNLDDKFCQEIVNELVKKGYKVFINTKSNKYDYLISDKVKTTFLSLKDTYILASKCRAIIGVRCGLLDCLQSLIHKHTDFFIIYNKKSYPHYKYFKKFFKWFQEAYSFNNINKTNKFNEYFYPTNLNDIKKNILDKLYGENTNV